MRGLGASLTRAIAIAMSVYLIVIGATFNGIVLPEFKMLTLALLALLGVVWLFSRWRGGWHWHRTSLDAAMLIWALAFALSLLANGDAWRRIVMGLWFVGLYIVVWYALHDLISNGRLQRGTLVDGLLAGGLIVMIFGYMQLQGGLATGQLPRPVGPLGNPNALGGFMVVIVPLVLARAFEGGRVRRVLFSVYFVLALLLLFLTLSRGAWIGVLVSLAVWGALMLAARDLLSWARISVWWAEQIAARKLLVSGGLLLVVVTVVLIGLRLTASLSEGGRDLSLRTYLYDAALTLFAEKPITGTGLFTFGRGLTRLYSTPPLNPHSHAHNVPLNIAAEMGIVGIAAMVVSVFVLINAMRRNWQVSQGRERTALAGAIAAVVGFGVHHLLDMPSMMPTVALTGIVALVLAAAPLQPVVVENWQHVPRWAIAGVLLPVLLVAGFWSGMLYSEYLSALRYGATTGDYVSAANRVGVIASIEPSLGLYHLEQGFLFGMAAASGDDEAAQRGIEAFDRFLAVEPTYAPAWFNKAALHAQLGQTDETAAALAEGMRLAPDDWTGTITELPDDSLAADFVYGDSYLYAQYLRVGISRQFLPQVGALLAQQ